MHVHCTTLMMYTRCRSHIFLTYIFFRRMETQAPHSDNSSFPLLLIAADKPFEIRGSYSNPTSFDNRVTYNVESFIFSSLCITKVGRCLPSVYISNMCVDVRLTFTCAFIIIFFSYTFKWMYQIKTLLIPIS